MPPSELKDLIQQQTLTVLWSEVSPYVKHEVAPHSDNHCCNPRIFLKYNFIPHLQGMNCI